MVNFHTICKILPAILLLIYGLFVDYSMTVTVITTSSLGRSALPVATA